MDFIKQLLLGSPDEWVHGRFVRYGKGVFEGPAASAKVGKSIKVSSSEEYCNTLGYVIASSCGGLVSVSGAIVGKSDFRILLRGAGIEFKDKSKKGLFNVEVSGDVSSDALKKVYASAADASVLLTLKAGEFSLKCKKKLPKPGGKKEVDFVVASLGLGALKLLREEVFFDAEGEFTEASIGHKYNISEIVLPVGVKDPARIRVEAKRKGFVERKLVFDGKENVSRKEFSV